MEKQFNFLKLILVFSAVSIIATAQTPKSKKMIYDDQVWGKVVDKFTISPKLTLINEIEDRRWCFPDHNYQLLTNSHLHYKTGESTDIALGFSYYNHSSLTSELKVPELRPYQSFTVKQRFGKKSLEHRYIVEEKFKRKTSSDVLLDDYDFNFCLRYKVQLSAPLLKKSDKLKLNLSNEVFINIGDKIVDNTFDQNRAYAGFNYKLSKNFSIEAGYMKYYQQKSTGYQYYDRDVACISITHNWAIKKKETDTTNKQ